jgi:Uma2 family endonuclease
MAAQPYDEWTYESYLDFEGRSETRHEYHQGMVYAMSGGTEAHSLISNNINGLLFGQLRGTSCAAHTSDILVAYPARKAAFYPDLSVVCGEARFDKGDSGDVLLNPTLVVEVLSQSTERKDYTIKLPIYQAMPSVMEILYVRRDRVHITHYKRDGDDWPTVFYRTLTDEIVLQSIGCSLRVADIYERITWNDT